MESSQNAYICRRTGSIAAIDCHKNVFVSVLERDANPCRVSNLYHFNADQDLAFQFNAHLNPAFHFYADPDPAPHQSAGNLSTIGL
jgi:hypothetical protein